MTNFAIHTQTLENYGAHSESGRYADGQAYWKFKPGTTYIVSDVERLQDAVAFVMAAFSENGIGWKEFPCHYETEAEWLAGMAGDDEDYQQFQKECARRVSPLTGREAPRYQEKEAA
jgi:hypothetical protein